MATYKSTQLTSLAGRPQTLADVREMWGKLRLIRATYVIAGTETVGQTIELARLTNAHGVHGVLSYAVGALALGTDVTIAIGTEAYTDKDGSAVAANATRFLAATSFATAKTKQLGGFWKNDVRARDGEVAVIATIGQTSSLALTAGRTLDVFLAVVQE